MKNTLFKNRGVFFILVFGTVVLFVGLVWMIATMVPSRWLGQAEPSMTAVISRTKNNCTYPVAFWKEHGEMFPSQVVLGSKIYRQEEIGEALSGENQELQTALQAQLFGAFLNMLAGADQDLISATVFQAYEWLVEHPVGSPLSDGESEAAIRFTSVLQAYNLGQAGVVQCPNVVLPTGLPSTSTPSSTVTRTTSQTPTPTLSQTITSSPSPTASPTGTAAFPIATVFVPSQTLAPTLRPTDEPPQPTDTQAPPPVPTNTPAPPTREPTVTLTLPPQFTLPPPP